MEIKPLLFQAFKLISSNPTSEWEKLAEVEWILDSFEYLREENIQLRQVLKVKDGQINILKSTLESLSQENEASLQTIRNLKSRIDTVPEQNNSSANDVKILSLKTAPPAAVQQVSPPPTTSTTTQVKRPQSAPRMRTHSDSLHNNTSTTATIATATAQPSSTSPARGILKSPKSTPTTLSHNTSVNETPKKPSRIDTIAERVLRSIQPPPSEKEMAKQVDSLVNEIKSQFKERGVELPLTKVKDSLYILGPTDNPLLSRRLNLYVSGRELKVRGVHQDLFDLIDQLLTRISRLNKQKSKLF